ncbi:MAG: preprotein translocase subunit YajC [Candidatus Omnitrophica bacterium]|nr:preprotein translocase subunit YajC [Candidatus Omnitrophota bacterium]
MNPGATAPNTIASLLPIIFIFGIFYFLLIRPQQKKQKEHNKMVSELKKNDEVVTNGGLHGTVVNVKDDTIILKVDENVKVEINKTAVAYLKKGR